MQIGHDGYCRVLSINGGGVRGLVPAKIIQKMVKDSGKQVHELFDFIVGTSIGGLLAAAYTVKGDGSNPKYTPDDVVDMMINDAQNIFPRNEALGFFGNTFQAKYQRTGIDNLLKTKLGDSKLTDVTIPILMVSYSLDKDGPRTWSTIKATIDEDENYALRDAAGATSAAPTYLAPKETDTIDGQNKRVDIDGGIFANSPTLIALESLQSTENTIIIEGKGCERFTIVSIGTGRFPRESISSAESFNHGFSGWLYGNRLINSMMQASEDSDTIISRTFFDVIRINPVLDKKYKELDQSDYSHMSDFSTSMDKVLTRNTRFEKLVQKTLKCLEATVFNEECTKATKDSLLVDPLIFHFNTENVNIIGSEDKKQDHEEL